MKYAFKPKPIVYLVLPIAGGIALWPASLLFLSLLQLIGLLNYTTERTDILLLLIPCYVVSLLLCVFYLLRLKFNLELEKGYLTYTYHMCIGKPPENIKTSEIQVLEIVWLPGEPTYDCCNIYSSGHEVTSFSSVPPLDDLLAFCTENNIIPLTVTVPFDVSGIRLQRKNIIIQYYGGKEEKIPIKDITAIQLLKAHPISYTLDRYNISTTTGAQYSFDQSMIKRKELAAYAHKLGLTITDIALYEEPVNEVGQ